MSVGVGVFKQYPQWSRGPCVVKGGHVTLCSDRTETYFMYEPTNLLFDLLDVYGQDVSPASVSRFVRKHGLLFHSGIGSEECREPLGQWREELNKLNAAAILSLELKAFTRGESAGYSERLFESVEILRSNIELPVGEEISDDKLIEQLSVLLAELITEGMGDTRAGLASSCWLDVTPRGPDTFLILNVPQNLLTAAYGQLALLLADKAPLSTCPGCGRIFVRESGKQKYHSPACASTTRWKRWKANQAN